MMTSNSSNSKRRILVVEDEADIRDLMLLHLKREGFATTFAEDGEQGLKLLSSGGAPFDLVVLDWMLPGLSGLEVCRSIGRRIPVLMVTARADASDIVLGLEVGADDYVTKPFEIPVFLARVRSLLRRSAAAGPTSKEIFEVGGLRVDADAPSVTCDGEETQLTASELKLLVALLKNQGRVLSREKLIELVQGQGVVVVDRAIDTHVFGLRKKLGSCASVIETIRGIGYRIGSGTGADAT